MFEYLYKEVYVLILAVTVALYTRVVPKVMSNFFLHANGGSADEGECGGRWNQLLCYP